MFIRFRRDAALGEILAAPVTRRASLATRFASGA